MHKFLILGFGVKTVLVKSKQEQLLSSEKETKLP